MKKDIVIGSVLKPVNDARMYEKIAISLSRFPDYEIHIAGFRAEVAFKPSNVHIYPLFDFNRLHPKRLFASWKFYKLLLKVKPKLTIITTHELLLVTCLYKILFGGKIIYDVQENYYRNIADTPTFPPLIRNLLAWWVRWKEKKTKPYISHYFLAEENYQYEFNFTRGKHTILENKALKAYPELHHFPHPPTGKIRLLYSGTIAEIYGIREAIDFATELHKHDPDVTLTIIGYCSKPALLKEIRAKISSLPFITLKGGDHLVPHQEILQEIARADFGLVFYQPNKSTINCIPTKLYEYLSFRLPMLVRENYLWEYQLRKYQAGIIVYLDDIGPELLLKDMRRKSFYPKDPGPEIYWESQEEKLFEAVKSIL